MQVVQQLSHFLRISHKSLPTKRIWIKLTVQSNQPGKDYLLLIIFWSQLLHFWKIYMYIWNQIILGLSYKNKCSDKPKLQELAKSIYKTSQKIALKFKISWITRNQNSIVGKILTIDYDNWKPTHSFYKNSSKIWGNLPAIKFSTETILNAKHLT